MLNQETLEKIEALQKKYKDIWGKEIDMNYTIPGMSQEKLVVVLERIVETGESILVGWNKCFMKDKHG